MPKNKFSSIDLFAGCGGLMDGFQQEGHFDTLACVEWEKAPCQTIANRLEKKWNHKNALQEVVRFDIQRTEELLNGFNDEEYGRSPGLNAIVGAKTVDVIIGGPPCQAYSLAGRIRDEHGMRDDYRNYLFESYVRIVSHFRPKFFVFENVVGMLSAAPDGTPIVSKIRAAFNEAGYSVIGDFKNALYDVADFGIPQHRKRVIILGVRNDAFGDIKILQNILHEFYDVQIPKLKAPMKTVEEAIGDLPKIYPSAAPYKANGKRFSHEPASSDIIGNHEPRFHSERDIKVFRMLAEDIQSGRNKYTSIESLKALYTEITGRHSNIHKFYVLRKNEPSNTIPAHLFKDGLRHIHPDPEQARSITVREAARLQTFPDDFEFLGSSADQYKMIGNAVPVEFASKVAHALWNTMKKYPSNA